MSKIISLVILLFEKKFFSLMVSTRAGNSLIGFLSESLVFCEKMSQWATRSKKRALRSFLVSNHERITHFWWATWAIRSQRSFLVSDLSDSLIKKEGMSESLICSFIMSDLSTSFTVCHLSWAPWAMRSRSLICLERPERFDHGDSFVLRDLSESLTVAHLICAKWVMSEWANSNPCWEYCLYCCQG